MADAADITTDPRTGNFLLVMPADIAADASLFISREETRYYLNGFEVRRHKRSAKDSGTWFAAATDGHRLVAFRLTGVEVICNPELMPEGRESLIVQLPKEVLAECRKSARLLPRKWLRIYAQGKGCDIVKAGDNVFTALSIERGSRLVEGGSPKDVLIDGTFPDWQRVIPRGELKPAHMWFNGSYLADYAKLGKSNGNNSSCVGIYTTGDCGPPRAKSEPTTDNPMIVRVSGRGDFLGVLMPMRCDANQTDPRQLVFGPKWVPEKPMTEEEIEAAKAEIGNGTAAPDTSVEAQIQE